MGRVQPRHDPPRRRKSVWCPNSPETPKYVNQALKLQDQIEKVARELAQVRHVLYLGRDNQFPAGHGRAR